VLNERTKFRNVYLLMLFALSGKLGLNPWG